MIRWKMFSAVLVVLAFVGAAALALVSDPSIGQAVQDDWYQWHPAKNLSNHDPAEVKAKFKLRGKTKGDVHPTEAVFGQIFVNTGNGREWIYDGVQWVPHDSTVEAYYEYLETVDKTPPGQECKVTPPGQVK